MRYALLHNLLITSCITLASSVHAMEPADCLERLRPIDEQIASGKYPEQNVQIAKQMRAQIVQTCSYIDEAHFDQMMAGFEQLLPTKSETEREADREAIRLERKAKRERQSAELDAKRAAKVSQAVEAKTLPVSDVLKRPPTGKTAIAKFIDRDDGMQMVTILDWDRYEGKSRVLYMSRPSRDQLNSPDAMNHYYVLVCDTDGRISQYPVRDMPLDRTVTAGLRGGHDEVIFQWPTAAPAPGSRLERWSISGGKLSSSATAPTLPWSGRQWAAHRDHFQLITTDGNLLFVGNTALSRGKRAIAWLKASPDGEVLSKGELTKDVGDATTENWFPTPTGGAGLLVDVSNFEAKGIETDIDTPLTQAVGGVELRGVIVRELRLVLVGRNSDVALESTAIEREFIWEGLDKLTSLELLENASKLTRASGYRHGAENRLVRFSTGTYRPGAVTAIDDGFGALVDVPSVQGEAASRDRKWLYEYAHDRTVNTTELTAAAEHLKARFVMLASPPADTVYLYAQVGGSRKPFLIKLDKERSIAAYSELSFSSDIVPHAMLADDAGIWVVGRGIRNSQFRGVWLERVSIE